MRESLGAQLDILSVIAIGLWGMAERGREKKNILTAKEATEIMIEIGRVVSFGANNHIFRHADRRDGHRPCRGHERLDEKPFWSL